MGILIAAVIAFVLLVLVGASAGALIGLPILINNVKETRRKQAEEAAARK